MTTVRNNFGLDWGGHEPLDESEVTMQFLKVVCIYLFTLYILLYLYVHVYIYIYLFNYLHTYIYMHVFDVNIYIYIMLPCLYDKMARYGTVSCTWHQNHKAPAWPGTSLSPFHLNITPNPTPGWEVVWRWFWDSWDCLFFGAWFMVHGRLHCRQSWGKRKVQGLSCDTHVPSTKAQFLYLGMLTLGMTPVHLRIRLQYA